MGRLATFTRRAFLFGAVAVAGGAAFGYYKYRQDWPNPLDSDAPEGAGVFNPYVMIAPDNTITVIVPRAEMGQGVTTTLAALVAEELDVPLSMVSVEHGPAGNAYFNTAMVSAAAPFYEFDRSFMAETVRSTMGVAAKFLGIQGTGGSTSTVDAFDKMREAGATAREMLKDAAAKRWSVTAANLKTGDGKVTGPASGQSLTYGELAAEAAAMEPREVALKARSDWKLLGKSQPRTDMLAKVTGAPVFGIDVVLPDMLFATVRMSPRFGAKPVKADAKAALAVPGVSKVVEISTAYGNGYGIIASNTWAAFKGAEALEVEWAEAAYPADSAGISKVLADRLAKADGDVMRDDGDVDTAFADAPADKVIRASYSVPYLAHATMEPMNATAQFKDGKLTLWSGNQAPTLARDFCADMLGIEEDAVTVHTTMMGGGFGRRFELDTALYATALARETDGRPVKVTWTREEDMRHDQYRPAAVAEFAARIGEDGIPVAVEGSIASPSILPSLMGRTYGLSPAGPDKLLTEGSHDQPYAIANYRVTGKKADLSIPIGFWRSVGNSYNAFFHESFIDETAHAGGIDPVEMRLKLMKDWPVATALVEKVAAMSGWKTPLPAGKARGLAFTLSFGTWVAEVVQVAETPDGIRIEKVWCAADLGTVLDPAIVKAQLMSGIIFGLSQALNQEITFADGMVEQGNFTDYDALRMAQCPEIEIELLENNSHMGGAGEPGTPPAAPALANAIFALTGKRVRTLPLGKEVRFA